MKEPTVQLWTRVSVTTALAVQAKATAANKNASEWLRSLVEGATGAEPAAKPTTAAKRTIKAPRKAVRK